MRSSLLAGSLGNHVSALLFGMLAGLSVTVGAQALPAASAAASAPAPVASTVRRSEEGVRWQALAPTQREALAPLEKEWPGIDSARKQKWVALASRFKSLGPTERARITERMQEWARLSPAERGQARIRFEEARQLPASDRNARWQAYQALPADAKANFAARAASAASSAGDSARRDALAARTAKAPRDSREGKANLVPNPVVAPPPKQVAPTIVQAASGATTTLITRRPAPPVHQQTGMPKIAATPEFVNRSTLLPKRGPQAAAVTPAAQPGIPGIPGVIVSPPVVVPMTPVVIAPPSPASAASNAP